MQQSELAVGHYLEYVRMSIHKELRSREVESCANAGRIFSGIAANVCEYHFHAIGSEDFHRFESAAQVGAIDIAIHGAHHWRNLLESVDNRFVANVASMPNFVAVLEILGIAVIPIGMSVG